MAKRCGRRRVDHDRDRGCRDVAGLTRVIDAPACSRAWTPSALDRCFPRSPLRSAPDFPHVQNVKPAWRVTRRRPWSGASDARGRDTISPATAGRKYDHARLSLMCPDWSSRCFERVSRESRTRVFACTCRAHCQRLARSPPVLRVVEIHNIPESPSRSAGALRQCLIVMAPAGARHGRTTA